MENLMLNGKLYEESEWKRCWISNYHDGGWVVGEVYYGDLLHYLVNSDNSGQLVIESGLIGWVS